MSKSQTSKSLITFRPNVVFFDRLTKLGEAWGVSASVAAHRLAIVAACGFDQGLVPEFAKFKPYVRHELGTDPFLATVMHFRARITKINSEAAKDNKGPLEPLEEAHLILRQLDEYQKHGVADAENLAFADSTEHRLVPSGDLDAEGRSILKMVPDTTTD